jgi:carboxypeptidase C (cathepsin A)
VPRAEVFFTSYQRRPAKADRPVTFLFNGGPGAASAFLHLGVAGPRRIAFTSTGGILPPPARLVENAESWLAFSDLVFVDPVGTGLSRTVAESKLEQQGVDAEENKAAERAKGLPDAKKPFYRVRGDIDVLTEFVSQWLSRFKRWDSPVSIAGESYGGFRVGKLVRALPDRGVGLRGAIMVSPAIDFLGLDGCDYDLAPWLNRLPTMGLAAAYHGKSRGRFAGMKPAAVREAGEALAEERLATWLIRGERTPGAARDKLVRDLADYTGMPRDLIERHAGRLPIQVFARELLRDEGLVCGLYDAAITGPEVFPDREGYPSPDPTLGGIMAAYSSGINTLLRRDLGLETDREYLLLGEDIYLQWQDDRMAAYYDRSLDCGDDMRSGLAMNPSLNLFICHGWYDLVTTYFSSERSVGLLRLPESLRRQVTLKHYDGGHMFYSWAKSRRALARDAKAAIS